MTLSFHPAVQGDFNNAISYYETTAGGSVADRFEAEIRQTLAEIASTPHRFPFHGPSRLYRRARPRSFPYLIVYRAELNFIHILVLKHEKRNPTYGLRRK